MNIQIEDDFDLKKIADSGQCFRARHSDDGTYRFLCKNRILSIRRTGVDTYEVSCSREDWHSFWYDYFDLSRNYQSIRASIDESDTYLLAAAVSGTGIRILRQDPWEILLTFIISQRKSIPAIQHTVELLAQRYGQRLSDAGETFCLFPTPDALQAVSEEAFRQCGLGYRAPYIHDAVRKVCDGEIDLQACYQYDDGILLETLKKIRGIGDKVANCICLFAYGRTALAPVDTWIAKAIREQYDSHNPFPRYGNAAGIMQQYIFYHIREQNRKRIAK